MPEDVRRPTEVGLEAGMALRVLCRVQRLRVREAAEREQEPPDSAPSQLGHWATLHSVTHAHREERVDSEETLAVAGSGFGGELACRFFVQFTVLNLRSGKPNDSDGDTLQKANDIN